MKGSILKLSILATSLIVTSILTTNTSALNYKLEDLGTLGGNMSIAYGINDSGQVVGESKTSEGYRRGFLYSNGTMSDIGALVNESVAYSINNSGQITGWAYVSGDTIYHAFLYENGIMRDLGTLGGLTSIGYCINNNGQIVGSSIPYNYIWEYAFLYENNVMSNLGVLGSGAESVAYGINDYGQIAGCSQTQGNFVARAFLYENGLMIDLGTFGGQMSCATGINNSGQIVGCAYYSDTIYHAFIYENNVMYDIGTLGGTNSYAEEINESGDIIGTSATENNEWHAFLYTNGIMYDLNDLLIQSQSGWRIIEVFDIDNFGNIVGYGINQLGETRAIYLQQIPEPSTLVLIFISFLRMIFSTIHRQFNIRKKLLIKMLLRYREELNHVMTAVKFSTLILTCLVCFCDNLYSYPIYAPFYSLHGSDELTAISDFVHWNENNPAWKAVDDNVTPYNGWACGTKLKSLLIIFDNGSKNVDKIQIINSLLVKQSWVYYTRIFQLYYTTDNNPSFNSIFYPINIENFLNPISGWIENSERNQVELADEYDEILLEFTPIIATAIKFYHIEGQDVYEQNSSVYIREISIDEVPVPEPSTIILLVISSFSLFFKKKK